MVELKVILQDQTSDQKADAYEKLKLKVNPHCTSLLINLTWQLAKSYFKQAVTFCEFKNQKKGMSVIKKATQFFAEAENFKEHHHPDFKTKDKFEELSESLVKQSKIIGSYFEFQ